MKPALAPSNQALWSVSGQQVTAFVPNSHPCGDTMMTLMKATSIAGLFALSILVPFSTHETGFLSFCGDTTGRKSINYFFPNLYFSRQFSPPLHSQTTDNNGVRLLSSQ